jgi:hypothetical protein
VKRLLVVGALAGLMSCRGCVARGARVRVPGGTRPIEELTPGDDVICVDPHSGELVVTPLVAVRSARRECVQLSVGTLTLTLTSDHPVYCPQTDQWAPAGDWALGNRTQLLEVTTEGVRPVEVTQVRTYCGVHEVFDLSVDHPLHNFVANGLLVHNKKHPPDPCELPNGSFVTSGSDCTCPDGAIGAVSCDPSGDNFVCEGCSPAADAGPSDGG